MVINTELEKTFKNDPGTANGCIGLMCKIDKQQIIFNTDENSVEDCEYMEINFMEKHRHGIPYDTAINHIESIYPIGKTPKKREHKHLQ